MTINYCDHEITIEQTDKGIVVHINGLNVYESLGV